MKKIKKQPIFSEDMTPCHVVMINDHGLSSCFDSCDAVIKDHQVFAYKKQRSSPCEASTESQKCLHKRVQLIPLDQRP